MLSKASGNLLFIYFLGGEVIHVTNLRSAMGVGSAARAGVVLLPGAVAVAASCVTTDRGGESGCALGSIGEDITQLMNTI